MDLRIVVIRYHQISTVLLMIIMSLYFSYDSTESVATNIIMYICIMIMGTIGFLIIPIFLFLLTRILMFGGLLLIPYYAIIGIGVLFGDQFPPHQDYRYIAFFLLYAIFNSIQHYSFTV